ncbi:asparagine synthase [Streptomyces mashuensis]|uniref:asparagine synthase (glutamine-hydrolyzing) n=1 Tax=Streptomyces mashuensis TaxID=33904 RepID=A0A919EDE2_9ACTN|nr:asparagine synthase-related protein [Streptomyces mashuensis]GHF48154.1 asparagine synthase [Streptomyces mashuensis]
MTGDSWFTVLPDGEAGRTAARALRPLATEAIEHVSGRPWLLGRWPHGTVTVATVGTARIAVIGRCPVTAGVLATRAARVRGVEDVERAVQGLPGSYHVVASLGRRVRIRGSASGVRRVFHTLVGEAVVAADRPDTLAALTGAGADERQLAVHLLHSPPLHPLDDTCVWAGVESLRPHDSLLIEADGRARTRRWWTPPEPALPAAEGVHGVRQALEAAVRTCTAGGGTISSDLSGGMDSTSLCFLAARDNAAHLVTLRWESRDPDNDDPAWAARATARLPRADHLVAGRQNAPWYSGLAHATAAATAAEPGAWVRDTRRLHLLARLMTDRGSRLHMMGGGGDELFLALPSHLHDYVRSHPFAALARLRRQLAFQPVPLWPVLKGLADRSTYAQWLAARADGLTAALPAGRHSAFSVAWGDDHPMPSWATPDAVRTVRHRLRRAAAGALPLAPQRGQHASLACVLAGGRGVHQIAQVMAAHDLEYAAPYLDDAVLDAALAVRVHERLAPGRYKPVLADAMRGIVPDAILGRSTKGEYSAEFHEGLRRNRATLLDLFDDSSLLARAGLIDPAVLRARLLTVHPDPTALRDLDATLGCEVWLRSHARRTAAVPTGGTP